MTKKFGREFSELYKSHFSKLLWFLDLSCSIKLNCWRIQVMFKKWCLDYLHHIILSPTNYLTEDDGPSNIPDFMEEEGEVKKNKFLNIEKSTKTSGKIHTHLFFL